MDRCAFDRIIAAGGYIARPPAARRTATRSSIAEGRRRPRWTRPQCIGCGACVAACPNASASLFTAAKISHLGLLPQGQPERLRRALAAWSTQMDAERFGGCTLYGECQEACPKRSASTPSPA